MGKRLRSSRHLIGLSLVVLVAVVAGWWIARYTAQAPLPEQTSVMQENQTVTKRVAHLYFGDAQGHYLTAEQRVVNESNDPVAFARRLVAGLIEGPREGGSRTLPEDTRLRAAYLLNDGTCVLDFSEDAFDTHPGGVGAELLSIYSIVNTLVLNIEAIRSVKILIGGSEAAVLAGHISLQKPFTANMLWVR